MINIVFNRTDLIYLKSVVKDYQRNDSTQVSILTLSKNNNASVVSYDSILKRKSCQANSRRSASMMLRKSDKLKRRKSYTRTTRVLVLISTSFLILHTPMALCKFITYFEDNAESLVNDLKIQKTRNQTSNQSFSDEILKSNSRETLERISYYIYYLNFALNFFLYSFNKSNFRKVIKRLMLRK